MAGSKRQKPVDEKPKKRKREAQDADSISKRHRKDAKGSDAMAGHGDGKRTSGASGDITKSNGTKHSDQRRLDVLGAAESETGWRISKPMGGRMLDVDPILTEDEQ